MTQDLKVKLVITEILFGLASGIAGAVLCSLIEPFIWGWVSLDGSVMLASIAGYMGMLAGVGIAVYVFVNKSHKRRTLLKYFLQGFLGLAIGLAGLYLIVLLSGTWRMPNALINSLLVVFPLTGAILGFNYSLYKDSASTEMER